MVGGSYTNVKVKVMPTPNISMSTLACSSAFPALHVLGAPACAILPQEVFLIR